MRAFEYIDNNRKAKTTHKAIHKHSGNLFVSVATTTTTTTTSPPLKPTPYYRFRHMCTRIHTNWSYVDCVPLYCRERAMLGALCQCDFGYFCFISWLDWKRVWSNPSVRQIQSISQQSRSHTTLSVRRVIHLIFINESPFSLRTSRSCDVCVISLLPCLRK